MVKPIQLAPAGPVLFGVTNMAHTRAGHGRSLSVYVGPGRCDVCGQPAPVILADNSDDEYHAVQICKGCADVIFTAFAAVP